MKGLSLLKECSYCHMGIGKDTFKSITIVGQYCTSDCYVDAMIDKIGSGLKGKFDLKTDGHGGVELATTCTIDNV